MIKIFCSDISRMYFNVEYFKTRSVNEIFKNRDVRAFYAGIGNMKTGQKCVL